MTKSPKLLSARPRVSAALQSAATAPFKAQPEPASGKLTVARKKKKGSIAAALENMTGQF